MLVRSLQENKSVVTSASSKLRTVHIISFRAPARGRDRGRLLGIYYLLLLAAVIQLNVYPAFICIYGKVCFAMCGLSL